MHKPMNFSALKIRARILLHFPQKGLPSVANQRATVFEVGAGAILFCKPTSFGFGIY